MLLRCKNHSAILFQVNDLRLYNLVLRLAVISGLFAVIIVMICMVYAHSLIERYPIE